MVKDLSSPILERNYKKLALDYFNEESIMPNYQVSLGLVYSFMIDSLRTSAYNEDQYECIFRSLNKSLGLSNFCVTNGCKFMGFLDFWKITKELARKPLGEEVRSFNWHGVSNFSKGGGVITRVRQLNTRSEIKWNWLVACLKVDSDIYSFSPEAIDECFLQINAEINLYAYLPSYPKFAEAFDAYNQWLSKKTTRQERTQVSNLAQSIVTHSIDKAWLYCSPDYIMLDLEEVSEDYGLGEDQLLRLKKSIIEQTGDTRDFWLDHFVTVSTRLSSEDKSRFLHLSKFMSVSTINVDKGIEKFMEKTHYEPKLDPMYILKAVALLKRAIYVHGNSKTGSCLKDYTYLAGPDETPEQIRLSKLVIGRFLSGVNSVSDELGYLMEKVKLISFIEKEFELNSVNYSNDKTALSIPLKASDLPKSARPEMKLRMELRENKRIDHTATELSKKIRQAEESGARRGDPGNPRTYSQEDIDSVSNFMPDLCARSYNKEKEKKLEGRLYAAATVPLKDTLSFVQAVGRTVLQAFPEQIMTLNGDRKSEKLGALAKHVKAGGHSRVVHMDIKSHNQSFHKDLMRPFWITCLEALGYETEDLSYCVHLFEYLTVCLPCNSFGDWKFSASQRGGIEGWMAFLWSVITNCIVRLALEEVRAKKQLLGFVSYNDDIIIIMKEKAPNKSEFTEKLLSALDENLIKASMVLKKAQTHISDRRLSMLKVTYIDGKLSEAGLKAQLRISLTTEEDVCDYEMMASNLMSQISSSLMNCSNYMPVEKSYGFYLTVLAWWVLSDRPVDLRDMDSLRLEDSLMSYNLTQENMETICSGTDVYQRSARFRILTRWCPLSMEASPHGALAYTTSELVDLPTRIAQPGFKARGSGNQLIVYEAVNSMKLRNSDLTRRLETIIDLNKSVLLCRLFNLPVNGGLHLQRFHSMKVTGHSNAHITALFALNNRALSAQVLGMYDYETVKSIFPRTKQGGVGGLCTSEYLSYFEGETGRGHYRDVIRRVVSQSQNAEIREAFRDDSFDEVALDISEALSRNFNYRVASCVMSLTKPRVSREMINRMVSSRRLLRGEHMRKIAGRLINTNRENWVRLRMFLSVNQTYRPTSRSFQVSLDELKGRYFPDYKFMFTAEPHPEEVTCEVNLETVGPVPTRTYIFTTSMRKEFSVASAYVTSSQFSRLALDDEFISRKVKCLRRIRQIANWFIRDYIDEGITRSLEDIYEAKMTMFRGSDIAYCLKRVYSTWGESGRIELVRPNEMPIKGEILHRIEYEGAKQKVRLMGPTSLSKRPVHRTETGFSELLGGENGNLNWAYLNYYWHEKLSRRQDCSSLTIAPSSCSQDLCQDVSHFQFQPTKKTMEGFVLSEAGEQYSSIAAISKKGITEELTGRADILEPQVVCVVDGYGPISYKPNKFISCFDLYRDLMKTINPAEAETTELAEWFRLKRKLSHKELTRTKSSLRSLASKLAHCVVSSGQIIPVRSDGERRVLDMGRIVKSLELAVGVLGLSKVKKYESYSEWLRYPPLETLIDEFVSLYVNEVGYYTLRGDITIFSFKQDTSVDTKGTFCTNENYRLEYTCMKVTRGEEINKFSMLTECIHSLFYGCRAGTGMTHSFMELDYSILLTDIMKFYLDRTHIKKVTILNTTCGRGEFINAYNHLVHIGNRLVKEELSVKGIRREDRFGQGYSLEDPKITVAGPDFDIFQSRTSQLRELVGDFEVVMIDFSFIEKDRVPLMKAFIKDFFAGPRQKLRYSLLVTVGTRFKEFHNAFLRSGCHWSAQPIVISDSNHCLMKKTFVLYIPRHHLLPLFEKMLRMDQTDLDLRGATQYPNADQMLESFKGRIVKDVGLIMDVESDCEPETNMLKEAKLEDLKDFSEWNRLLLGKKLPERLTNKRALQLCVALINSSEPENFAMTVSSFAHILSYYDVPGNRLRVNLGRVAGIMGKSFVEPAVARRLVIAIADKIKASGHQTEDSMFVMEPTEVDEEEVHCGTQKEYIENTALAAFGNFDDVFIQTVVSRKKNQLGMMREEKTGRVEPASDDGGGGAHVTISPEKLPLEPIDIASWSKEVTLYEVQVGLKETDSSGIQVETDEESIFCDIVLETQLGMPPYYLTVKQARTIWRNCLGSNMDEDDEGFMQESFREKFEELADALGLGSYEEDEGY